MYKQTVGLLGVISAIVMLAISPTQAADLTVDGNLSVKSNTVMLGNAQVEGKLGIGVANPGAHLQINQIGSGVGIYLGDRTPFGQALFETDLTAPATHAWFAEKGERVFSVTGGGNGFFKRTLQVGTGLPGFPILGPAPELRVFGTADFTNLETGDANIRGSQSIKGALVVDADAAIGGKLSIGGSLRLVGDLSMGDPFTPGTGNASITGNVSFGTQPRQMLNLFDGTYGIGVQASALYQRTDGEFAWYRGGTHSSNFLDAGGGELLMRLGRSGDLIITHSIVTPVLQITGGTDLAEPFKMARDDIPKGAVVIIDDENVGQLRMSESAYDKRVAGIVSGANGIHPGISLSQQGVVEGGQNVALSGRVYVLADASSSPIKPGDLLTTSDTPGYAMKVTDHARAQGAVIGKAMSAMKEGKGMVLVLVTLQ